MLKDNPPEKHFKFPSWEQDTSSVHQKVDGVNNASTPSAAQKLQDISYKS